MKKKTLIALSLTSLIGLTGSVQPKAKTDNHTKIQEIKNMQLFLISMSH